jgi:hypothetical protein
MVRGPAIVVIEGKLVPHAIVFMHGESDVASNHIDRFTPAALSLRLAKIVSTVSWAVARSLQHINCRYSSMWVLYVLLEAWNCLDLWKSLRLLKL